MATKLAEATEYGSLASLTPSWERSLRADNKSPKTLRSYGDTARAARRLHAGQLRRHAGRQHYP